MSARTQSRTLNAIPNRGQFASERQALREVVRRLAEALDPVEIWLFGSRATGRHAVDSDFDLLVVTRDEDGGRSSDYDRAYAPLRGLGIGCDVVPVQGSDFATERLDLGSLCHRIVNSGRRIYERQTRCVLPSTR